MRVHADRNCGRDALDRAVETGTTVPSATIAEIYGLSRRSVERILARAKAKLANLPLDPNAVAALLEQMERR